MTRELWKGNDAFAEAAIRAGLQAYFGYPITPQNETLEYMSWRMPELNRVFLQAESELGAINMVYGAACAGVRVMTSTSGPGASLMMESLSYIAATDVPAILVNVTRAGPGLANISPSQGDYNQMVHGGGHGDYHPIVLAPASIQETVDIVYDIFDIADKYKTIGVVLIDGCIGQMMEAVELPPMLESRNGYPEWAIQGGFDEDRHVLKSIFFDTAEAEAFNMHLVQKWGEIEKNEIRYKEYYMEDAKMAVIGFGISGRIALSAVKAARKKGLPVGLLRPISLSPFPHDAIREAAEQVDHILVVEMNSGMMLEDVMKNTNGNADVSFYGRMGGVIPFPEEIEAEIDRILMQKTCPDEHPRTSWFRFMESAV